MFLFSTTNKSFYRSCWYQISESVQKSPDNPRKPTHPTLLPKFHASYNYTLTGLYLHSKNGVSLRHETIELPIYWMFYVWIYSGWKREWPICSHILYHLEPVWFHLLINSVILWSRYLLNAVSTVRDYNSTVKGQKSEILIFIIDSVVLQEILTHISLHMYRILSSL